MQALLAVSRDAVLLVRHADRVIVAANPVAERLYGPERVGPSGAARYDDLVTDRHAVPDIFDQHRTHVPLRYHLRADGARFPVEMSIHWFTDLDGSELGCFGVRDLSREEEDGRRLRAAENSYRAIFRAAPFPVLLLDRRGVVSDANEAALALYRHSLATLVGQPVAALLQDGHQARRYFRAPHWHDAGQWHRRRDGEPFLADVDVSMLRLSVDVHAMVVLRDVTEERALLARVQASEARWRFALEGHGDALWEWDLVRGVFEVSHTLGEWLGRLPEPQEQVPAYWAERVHPGDRERLTRALVAHLKDETALVDVEVRLTLHDGESRWVWLRGRVMARTPAGRAQRMIGSVRDVHDQKIQAEALVQWREQVQHAARLTSMAEMAAALAHELNQPLTAIRNFSAATLRRLDKEALRDTAEVRRAVQLIADEAMRAGRIMQHIRGVVRRDKIHCAPVQLDELVRRVQHLAELQARRLGATIDLRLDPGLPPVLADRVLAEQLLLNLVRNGLEAMHAVEGERRLVIATAAGEAGLAEVSVHDRGSGLPTDPGVDIYTPFVTTKDEGLGMGLAICRSIVESHQGHLWAEPRPDGGTVFRFTLPLAVPAKEPVPCR
jgi:PAS domain S-box-containing protein